MINIHFYGLCCDQTIFDKYLSLNNNPYSVAHRAFEGAIIEELSKDNRFKIVHKYIWQGKSQKKILHGKQKLKNNVFSSYLGFINLPVLKFFTIFVSCIFNNLTWYLKNRKMKKIIISSINYGPVAAANFVFNKLFRVKNIIILTDTSISNAYDKLTNNGLKKIIIKPYAKIIEFFERNYDGYIFLSKFMNEQINTMKKPWCLVEGIYNPENMQFVQSEKKNAIMHAGTINKNLGLDKLIQAFKKINIPDLELWIFGSGNYVDEMINEIKSDERICYFGFQPREQILNKEAQASLLINTRDPKDEYTRYSFPSKTMEYMASGTPFMTTKLDCYPSEYYEYMILIEDYSIDSIVSKINDFFSKNEYERKVFGNKAQSFILENKTKDKQVNKIKSLILDKMF